MRVRGARFSLLVTALANGCAREEKSITKAPERADAPAIAASPSTQGPVFWLVLDRRRMEKLSIDYRDVEASLGREPKVSFSLERYDADMYELRLGPVKEPESLMKRPVGGKLDLESHLRDLAKLEARRK